MERQACHVLGKCWKFCVNCKNLGILGKFLQILENITKNFSNFYVQLKKIVNNNI